MFVAKSLVDAPYFTAKELSSDGYYVYLSTSLISTDFATKQVLINVPADGNGIIQFDHPAKSGDRVRIVGTSGASADGYFIIDQILDEYLFTVRETIASSTGGIIYFMYNAGAKNIGFDNKSSHYITHTNVQDAITDLDAKIYDVANSGGGGGDGYGITIEEHPKLKQLIHLVDGIGGPFEGFTSGAYRETTPLNHPFPSSVIWYTDISKTKKILEKSISYNLMHLPYIVQYKVYNTDGSTVLAIVTDTISYIGSFENSRVRDIQDFSILGGNLTVEQHKTIRQLIHLADGIGGPFEGFTSGAYREILPQNTPFPTSIIWYTNISKTHKIFEKQIFYDLFRRISSIILKVYDVDGVTVLTQSTDNINYSTGFFESNRIRSIL